MPQATDEQRDQMKQWFGDEVSDAGAIELLLSHGFTESRGMWAKPTSAHTVSCYELECLNFLCDEWDYAYEEMKPVICLCGQGMYKAEGD